MKLLTNHVVRGDYETLKMAVRLSGGEASLLCSQLTRSKTVVFTKPDVDKNCDRISDVSLRRIYRKRKENKHNGSRKPTPQPSYVQKTTLTFFPTFTFDHIRRDNFT